jgi:hypothetical protein
MPKLPERILSIIEELIDQYQKDDRYNRPWIEVFLRGKQVPTRRLNELQPAKWND